MESTGITSLAQRAALALAAERDRVVKLALDGALGVNAWSLDTVAHRASWQAVGGTETLLLDGRPLVGFSRKPFNPDLDHAGQIDVGFNVTHFPWRESA